MDWAPLAVLDPRLINQVLFNGGQELTPDRPALATFSSTCCIALMPLSSDRDLGLVPQPLQRPVGGRALRGGAIPQRLDRWAGSPAAHPAAAP